MEVSAKSISKKSLFKLLLQSIGLGLMVFCLVMGFFSIFGFETINWDGEYITGFMGFVTSIFLGAIMALMFTCFMWLLGILGLWVNSYFGGVKIVFKEASTKE